MSKASLVLGRRPAAAGADERAALVRLDAALLAINHFYGSREVRSHIERSGVEPRHRNLFAALRAIRDLPQPVSIKAVQGEIGLSHPATCRVIDRCVAAGLVDRRPADHDRRHMALDLTEAGEAVIRSVETARQDVIASLVAGWNAGERSRLLALLEQLEPELAALRARLAGGNGHTKA